MKEPGYVFDTGVLIQLRNYPRDIFPGLWERLESMIREGKIIFTSEVFREISERDDEISKWAKQFKENFPKPTEKEQEKVKEILTQFPLLIKKQNILANKADADPFVIAKAAVEDRTVVSTEKKKPNAPKIPNVCEHFKVPHMTLFDFFRAEGLSF